MRVCFYPTEGPYGVGRYIEGLLKELPQFVELVDLKEEADVYHTQLLNPPRFVPRTDVFTFHATVVDRNPFIERHLLVIGRINPKFIVVPSEWQRQALEERAAREGVKLPEVVPIHHGVQFERLPEPRTTPDSYILWGKAHIGRVGTNDILAEVAEHFPKLKFKSTLWNEKVPKPANIEIIGCLPFDLMMKTMNRCSMMIFTWPESGGIQAYEAMALGKPVLSVASGGVAEVIKHKKTGYLWRNLEELCEGINYCSSHYAEIGEAAKAGSRELTWENSARQHVQMYKRCLP